MNEQRPGGGIRIGDREREDAVKRLGEHYEAGRLDAEEHGERVDRALQAKTRSDLDALFADLPGGGTTGADPAGAGATAGGAGTAGAGWAGAAGPAAAGGGPGEHERRPPWAGKGPLGRIPSPVLIALAAIALIATIGCVVVGGHPPILPLLLIGAGVVLYTKRRSSGPQGWRA